MPVRVYATAFRHRTPGEGVGGVEWDFVPGEARKRVDAIVSPGEPYETFDVEYDLPVDVITDYVDARIWDDWGR